MSSKISTLSILDYQSDIRDESKSYATISEILNFQTPPTRTSTTRKGDSFPGNFNGSRPVVPIPHLDSAEDEEFNQLEPVIKIPSKFRKYLPGKIFGLKRENKSCSDSMWNNSKRRKIGKEEKLFDF